jgi:hypothetical protein
MLKRIFVLVLLMGTLSIMNVFAQANHDLVFYAYQTSNLSFTAKVIQPRPASFGAGMAADNSVTMDALFTTDDNCAIVDLQVSCPNATSTSKLRITDGYTFDYLVPFSGTSARYYGKIPLSSGDSTRISVTVVPGYY